MPPNAFFLTPEMSTDAAAISPAASADGSGSAPPSQPLSKSQKKRLQRNRAKAKREALEKEQREKGILPAAGGTKANGKVSTGGGSAALNPHERLRADLLSRGFTLPEIESAQEEMWNLQMPYDELDAVLSYLEGKRAQEAADSRRRAAAAAAPPAARSPPVEEESTASTAASTTAALFQSEDEGSRQAKQGGFDAVQEEAEEEPQKAAVEEAPEPEQDEPPAEEEEEEAAAPEPVAPQPSESRKRKSKKRPEAQPMDLAAKLDMVASYENLADALFALTEWTTKAAKADEIADLCAAQKTRALATVIRRSILESRSDPVRFDDAILPAVLDLIGGILRASGAPRAAVIAAAKALSSVLVQARQTVSSSAAATSSESVASAVSDLVCSGVARAVEVSKYSSSSTGGGSAEAVRRIEEEIDALASSLVANSTGGGGVVELMTKRDTHRVAAEKSSTVVEITILSSSGDSAAAPPTVEEGDSGRVDDRIASLLGDAYESVRTSRAEHGDIDRKLSELQSDTAEERSALNAELGACRTERETISTRMEELRREMEVLEARDNDLAEREDVVGRKIADLDGNCSAEVTELRLQLDEKAKAMELEDATRALVEGLDSFEAQVLKSVAAASAPAQAEGAQALGEKLSNKMGIYLVRMRNYFKAEADCVEFLGNRARSLESGLGDLEREIEECAALGMTTNVSQMTQSLNTTRQNVADDLAVVDALRGEAVKMRDDLMKRLEEYNVASGAAPANHAFTSLHVSVLNGIMDAMARIGLSDDRGLGSYVSSLSGGIVSSASEEQRRGMDGDDAAGSAADVADEVVETVEPRGYVGDNLMNGENGTAGAAVMDVSAAADPVPAAPLLEGTAPPGVERPPQKAAPVAPVAPPPEPVPVLPKLSWATNGAAKKKGEVKSFLDIQKEELSAKSED